MVKTAIEEKSYKGNWRIEVEREVKDRRRKKEKVRKEEKKEEDDDEEETLL